MQCVGIGSEKKGEYNGYPYSHIPVYATYEHEEIDGLGTFKVNVPTKVGIGDLRVGDDFDIQYNRFGKVSGIIINE